MMVPPNPQHPSHQAIALLIGHMVQDHHMPVEAAETAIRQRMDTGFSLMDLLRIHLPDGHRQVNALTGLDVATEIPKG